MQTYELTIEAAADLLQRGEMSSLDLTRSVLDRIADLDDRVGAYLTVDREGALDQAWPAARNSSARRA